MRQTLSNQQRDYERRSLEVLKLLIERGDCRLSTLQAVARELGLTIKIEVTSPEPGSLEVRLADDDPDD